MKSFDRIIEKNMFSKLFKFLPILLSLKILKAEYDVIDLTNNEFQLDCLLSHNKFREKHCSSELKYSHKVSQSF